MIQTELLKNYLQAYLKFIVEEKSSFFISFCDVDFPVFEVLSSHPDLLGSDIRCAFISKDDYHTAVELRNNKEIQKILIFTIRSVKSIDSLKHFSEFPLLPQSDNFPHLWDVLCATFSNFEHKNTNYRKHFEIILQLKKPTLEKLFDYLSCCSAIDEKALNKQLNTNLCILDCWNADASDTLLPMNQLKKIIRYSQTDEIDRRLSELSSTSDLNVKEKKTIEQLVFQSRFGELFRRVPFSKVQAYFKSKARSSRAPVAEETEQHLYSYQAYWAEKSPVKGDLEQFEESLAENWMEYAREEGGLDQYQAAYSWLGKQLPYSFAKATECVLDDLTCLEQKIRDRQTNIRPEKKDELSKQLCTVHDAFLSVFENWDEPSYPFLLKTFLSKAMSYAEAYFQILKSVFADERLRMELETYGLLSDLLQLFILQKDQYCHMPFYHPFFIVYLYNQANYYQLKESLSSENTFDDALLEALSSTAIERLSQTFPIGTVLFQGIPYRLDYDFEHMPFCMSFIRATGESSITSIQPNLVYAEIERYIQKSPYITDLEILVIGDISMDTLVTLEEKTKWFLGSEENLLGSITLNLATSQKQKLRKKLDRLFENDQTVNRLRIKFFTKTELLADQFAQVVEGKQLVLILDSQFLYTKEWLRDYSGLKNNMRDKILYSDIPVLFNSFGEPDSPLALLWDTLHSVLLKYPFRLCYWEYNQPNPKILGDIARSSIANPLMKVVTYSSNTNLSQHLFVDDHFSCSNKNNKGNYIQQLEFRSSPLSSALPQEEAELRIHFPLTDLIDAERLSSLLSLNPDQSGDVARTILSFALCEDAIHAELAVSWSVSDSPVDDDDLKNLTENIIKTLYGQSPSPLLGVLCTAVKNALYASCSSYGQAFLCHYISHSLSFEQLESVAISHTLPQLNGTLFHVNQARDFCEKQIHGGPFSESTLNSLINQYQLNQCQLDKMTEEARKLLPLTPLYYGQMTRLTEEVQRYDINV